MKSVNKVSVLLALAVGLSGAAIAHADYSNNFDTPGALTGWTTTGATSTTQAHSGTHSLFLDYEQTATYQFSPTDAFGAVTMWVYDEGKWTTPAVNADGPHWAITDSSGVAWGDGITERTANTTNTTYQGQTGGSPTGAWFDYEYDSNNARPVDVNGNVIPGWHEFVFNHPDASTLTVSVDGGTPVSFTGADPSFADGFNGIAFNGGGFYSGAPDQAISGVYIDDISFVAAAATPEPASLSLLGLAAGGLLLKRRRRHA